MLSNQKIKWIKSLELKKYRKESGCFVVEGEKMVRELLKSSFQTTEIYATPSICSEMHLIAGKDTTIEEISDLQLERISQLKNPNQVLAVAKMPEFPEKITLQNELYLALDNIQDPGNLGTIIRTAAWFGIKTIFCSPETVDAFNPKVVQSTMGAIFSVNLVYAPLEKVFAESSSQKIPIFGTQLNGKNMYSLKLPQSALIVMGNESKGLSEQLSRQVSENLLIPTYPAGAQVVESLNVSVATAIICTEFRRQHSK